MLQLEYKSTFTNFKKARPIYGAFITEKLSSYFYCGVGYDIFLGKYLVFTPSIAAGIYFQGNGKKLHYPLEFRSSAELCYVFKNKSRIGGQFYHISNASLGRKNPGVEALLLTYSFAL
jgi:lipid A 3-O-deacylase